MSRSSPQLLCFSYHKSGTSLFLHVMTKVCERLGLTLANHYGLVERLDPEPDVVLLPHSIIRGPLRQPYRAIRMIRDPRDIWVSGYLYHLRCDEEWCRNSDLDPTPPIGWPRVDYSVLHWPEDWKRRYLKRLSGKSYQQNLLDRSRDEGLAFELDGYTGCTLATMRDWASNGIDALDVKLEAVMADFDGSMLRVFDHFGFTASQRQAALIVARSEDVGRMDDAAIAARPQINSRTISKWRTVLSVAQVGRFEERHADLISELGYEPIAGDVDSPKTHVESADFIAADITAVAQSGAPNPVMSPMTQQPQSGGNRSPVVLTSPDAKIRLLVDGIDIFPTATSQGSYTFIVHPDAGEVRLESRWRIPANPNPVSPTEPRRLGVKVSGIKIQSDIGERVIAADDPGLSQGWHDAERVSTAWCRWTDGSAVLPWDGISGPAIVTVWCGTLAEYPIIDDEDRH
jgi:hypothetical protein